MKNSFTKNKQSFAISAFLLYTLFFTLVIPIQAEKRIPDNSVFNQYKTQNNQTIKAKVDKSFGNVPVYFEENRGQFNKDVKYFARGTNGYSLFLTDTESVYVLRDSKNATAVFMNLVGANENSISVGLEQLPHKTNYFRGNDSSKWRTNVPNFREININNIYSGIDAVWKGKRGGQVQYDFVVKPNANPNQIEWDIKGAESIEIDEQGDLLIKTESGILRQQKPFTYQKTESTGLRQEVDSKFKIQVSTSGLRVKFEVGNYDKTKTLTIDPTVNLSNLSFSTFLGGVDDDLANDIAVDRVGNVYVTGQTDSPSFPITPGTVDTSHNGSDDVFVTKMEANGSNLIYSTFLGGSGVNRGEGIAVDVTGNVYVTGSVTGTFPTTSGVFDTTPNGGNDVFASKLSSDGSSLIYSTFIGGLGNDLATALVIDASGNAYITGQATTIPTTGGAFDTTPNGGLDAFVTKLNPDATGLVYSTFIGGSSTDIADDIAIDSAGNAYITGETFDTTTDYPTTSGAFDEIHNGSDDVFVTKLNTIGSALVYSTFIGGTGADEGRGIAVDAQGNAYVTGETNDSTTDYPTTSGAFQTTHGGFDDIFVTKLNMTGSSLVYSTLIGGNTENKGFDIAINSSGQAFVTGQTLTNLPTTSGAFDTTQNGSLDAFLSKLNSNGTALLYSSYLGGNNNERGFGIALDSAGNAFIAGEANVLSAPTDPFPTTPEIFQPDHSGDDDAFISKFGDYSISGRTVDTSGNALANTAVASSGDTAGFMLSDTDGYFYFGDTRSSGTNLITATQTLYNFNPPNYEVFTSRNKEINFVGRPTSSGPTAGFADIGGNVQSQVGNVGLANTKLTLIDAASGQAFVTHSDDNGNYVFEGRLTGTYLLVVPQKEGYNFNPGVYEVNHLQESLSNDFLATPNSPRPVNDFDGDGKTDLAVFRPSEGNWYILESQSNNVRILRFGLEGDIPVASDFDGDNKADVAVFRPTDGNWYRINSSNGEFSAIHFGTEEDKPVQADFDGDGKTDLAVYRPSTGVWHKLMSSDGSYSSIKFGIETDIPIAADYDSDGKADLTVYRNGTWYHQMSRDNSVSIYQFGLEGDKPIKGDFDGDGKIDTSLYRPSTGVWYWIESSDQDIQAKQFGIATDIPTPSDYNGDGRYEQSVFREGIWYISNSDNSFYSNQFGKMGDVPIP